MSTIELTNLTKHFGDFVAVKDVHLMVAAGEVVCLLGPSGCGKTTTLRMIAGLERATAGDVVVAGKRMNDLPPEKRDIAMVFQFYALYPALPVGETIAFPLHYERLGREEIRKRVARVAKLLHLEGILDRLPGQISEGEKQRVAVARAIVRDPNCFLFDEPLSRLDVELRQSMRGQIKEVLAGLSKATVIVTHDQLDRSDPEATQRFDLGFIGTIPPGGEIILNAGLHSVNLPAENLYQWSISEVLRDTDDYDYARIIDAGGNQVTGMTCAGGPVDITQPTPVPTPQPAETPAPAPGTPAPTAAPLAEEIGPLPPGIVAGAQRNPLADGQQGPAVAADNTLPGVGGRPGADQDYTELILATGLLALLAGTALIASTRRPVRDSEVRRE